MKNKRPIKYRDPHVAHNMKKNHKYNLKQNKKAEKQQSLLLKSSFDISMLSINLIKLTLLLN